MISRPTLSYCPLVKEKWQGERKEKATTRQILEEILAGCTEEEKAKIAGGNAARVYHFD
jgi:hypothetical protein